MKQVIVYPSKLNGKLTIASSKSMSHRYIIAASLAKGESVIENVLNSDDTLATINIMKNWGININKTINGVIVNSHGLIHSSEYLDANESGSTLRFLIPLAWTFKQKTIFTGKDSLGSRPLSVYEKIAHDFNYLLSNKNGNFPITVKGPLRSGKYVLDGSISSQFISGLLFALPLVDGESQIIIENQPASKSYVDLTISVLNKAGIKVEEFFNGYRIAGNQTYQPLKIEVEGDYSQAAFFIVAALLTKSELRIANLDSNSKQGDKQILTIIEEMGAEYRFGNDELIIVGNDKTLKTTIIDLYNIPDLGPILMVLAASINDTTVFKNVNRLYTKESNRLLAMQQNLEKAGVEFVLNNNDLYLKGVDSFKGGLVFDSYNDHRIAMAMSIYGLAANEEIVINDYEAINKSYPNFYNDLEKVGGKIKYDK